MASDDFFPMESLLEVSLVEGGQQISTSDEPEEIIVDDPVTVSSEDSRTETSSEVDKLNEHVTPSAVGSKAVDYVTAVDADVVEEDKYLADCSIVSEDADVKDKSTVLSAVNIAATKVSEEEKEFYKDMFKLPSTLTSLRLHCTVCDRHIGLSAKTVMFAHRVLRVLLCFKCYGFYGSGEFQQGEDGSDMFCRWCGQGGRLLCCSSCSNVFCEKCISRNFGASELRKIKRAEEWFCFVCNLKSLWPERAKCAEMKNAIALLRRRATIAKARDGKNPPIVDESRCCSSELPNVRTSKGKVSVTSEEQKKPFAMIQPLPKKKVLNPAVVFNVSSAGEQNSQSYVTVPPGQTLVRQPQQLLYQVQRPHQTLLPSPSVTTKFTCTKTYERIRQVNPAHRSVMPVRFLQSVNNPLNSNSNSQVYMAPTARTKETSVASTFQSNIHNRFIQVLSAGHSAPVSQPQQQQQRYMQVWPARQKQCVPIQPKPTQQRPSVEIPSMQQQQRMSVLPSYQVVEPTIQLPNPRLLAPNQVYTVPASYIQSVVQGGAGHTQIPAHVLRPACPPLMPIRQEVNEKNSLVPKQPKSVDRSRVKTKWFVSGVEKFAGVSRVLWSHIHELKQTFANMEEKNDVHGMKVTACKLHRLLEKAAEHIKEIDKRFGKEFYSWCKNLKTLPEQLNVTSPEVIDITNEDDHPITLVDDTSAEVIEVEITPDIVSLGKFSSSADDVQYVGESIDSSIPFAQKINSKDSNGRKSTHQAAIVSTALDHAYSALEPVKTRDTTDESDVTLDLDICCESDEDDHDGDGSTADDAKVLECDDGDVWGAVEYDSDNSLNEKLLQAVDGKQVPCATAGDCMKLNEVTGVVEPNYDSLLQTTPNTKHSSLLNNLLKGKVTVTKIVDTEVSSRKDKSVDRAISGEQNAVNKVPKRFSISVQTDVSVDKIDSKKCEETGSSADVPEEKPIKPWSNEFDCFLKKLNLRSVHAPLCSSESAAAPPSPASKPSSSFSSQQVVMANKDKDFSENLRGLKKPVNKTLQKCSVKLEKVAFPDTSSCVAPDAIAAVRVRMKKEKADYVDTDSAVSKVLRSERRSSLLESRNSPAPESVKRKRLSKDSKSSEFEQMAKKVKCEVDVDSKYPEISRKMCMVKVERLRKK